jgi:lysophospholipase L1-like esterase
VGKQEITVNREEQAMGFQGTWCRAGLVGLTCLVVFSGTGTAVAETNRLAMVFGSSVAKGYRSGSALTNGSHVFSYAGRMTELLGAMGWTVTNTAIAGNTTVDALARFDRDVVPVAPQIVLIGLSLANEGLLSSPQPDEVCARFGTNMRAMIRKCRDHGFSPVVGLAYANNNYTPAGYERLRQMNLLINSWDVPSVNFLGALEDGNGHWAAGYSDDPGHPNITGHEELFLAFVPTLFDALAKGRIASPRLDDVTGYVRASGGSAAPAPLTFSPAHPMHSFTTAFRVRIAGMGTVATVATAVSNGYATVEVRTNGLVYVSPSGGELFSAVKVADGQWHDVALSHRYACRQTLLYVDGSLAGIVVEQLAPGRFILAGPDGAPGRASSPAVADYRNWCVYRAAWTPEEALAQHEGRLQQASMEIAAPLDDALMEQGCSLANRAQSLSKVVVTAGNLSPMAFQPRTRCQFDPAPEAP